MPYHVYVVDPPTLLDDLLEDSARVFHHHCGIIQRVFHERWLELLGDRIGQDQLENLDAKPAVIETRARGALRVTRLALREKQAGMIREESDKRTRRDSAIRTYVASLDSISQSAAA